MSLSLCSHNKKSAIRRQSNVAAKKTATKLGAHVVLDQPESHLTPQCGAHPLTLLSAQVGHGRSAAAPAGPHYHLKVGGSNTRPNKAAGPLVARLVEKTGNAL